MNQSEDSSMKGLQKSDIKPWELHKKLYNWVLGWADTKYGMLALIILALVEPICVPVPADVLVLGMSLGKPKNGIKYGLICSLFSVIGGTIALLLGLALGESVLSFFHSIDFFHIGEKADKALALYTKYDFWAISISALTPVPYMLFSWLAGMADVSVVKFVLISIVFRSLRFGSEGVLFYFLGEKARDVIEKHFNTATVAVMVLLGLIVFALKMLG